jgi:hypothetical protein
MTQVWVVEYRLSGTATWEVRGAGKTAQTYLNKHEAGIALEEVVEKFPDTDTKFRVSLYAPKGKP